MEGSWSSHNILFYDNNSNDDDDDKSYDEITILLK